MAKFVALLAEGVDRNYSDPAHREQITVALLAEGVDRNHYWDVGGKIEYHVALLAEGVDRNNLQGVEQVGLCLLYTSDAADE